MKNIKAILFSTIILFAWNAISWMALPFHSNSLQNLPERALARDIEMLMPGSGIYHYPGLATNEMSLTEIRSKLKKGPRITFMVYQEGSFELFEPAAFLSSLLLNLATCIILFIILSSLHPQKLLDVLKWSLLFGLLVSLASDFTLMNWYKFPPGYTLINVMDHLVGISLVGIVYWYLNRINFYKSFKEKRVN